MHIVTQFLSPSEACYGLVEHHEHNQLTGWRWIQKCFVARGDTIAKYITDLGPSEDFELSTPFSIYADPQGGDSVARVLAMAEKTRADTYWQTRAQEQLAESTLISDLIEQEEKVSQIIRNRTVSGPYQTNQRNGYDRERNQRALRDRRYAQTGKVKGSYDSAAR